MDGSAHLGAVEARANLKALGRGNRHHGVGQESLELVKGGLAEAGWAAADNAGDGAADRVVLVAELGSQILHLLCNGSIRAAHGKELVNLFAGEGIDKPEELGVAAERVDVVKELDLANRRHKGDNLDTVGLAQPLFSNSTGGDAGNGLAGTAAATTGGGLDSVLFEVGPVGVGGARVHVDCFRSVVFRALVFIHDCESDGRAQAYAMLAS